MFRLSDGEEIMTLAFFVLIQYWSVTDGRTDRRTDMPPGYTSGLHSWLYANALVKTSRAKYKCTGTVWIELYCGIARFALLRHACCKE